MNDLQLALAKEAHDRRLRSVELRRRAQAAGARRSLTTNALPRQPRGVTQIAPTPCPA